MNKLNKLAAAIRDAEAAMVKELARQYPVGITIRCEIQHGQINPSIGTVIGHEGDEYATVVVRLRSRTEEVRRVAAKNILGHL